MCWGARGCVRTHLRSISPPTHRSSPDGVELMIITIATFGQAVSGQAAAVNIISVLVLWRFLMGVGIGGDYPLSAVISAEFASKKIRGRMMTAVFANQGWGNFSE